MELNKKKLKRAIDPSQTAYKLYLVDKKYYQALRIRKANKNVYELLEFFLYECGEDEVEIVQNYLFHLEDWFNQFESECIGVGLNDDFVFTRLERGIPFPKEFKNYLQ